MKGKEKRQGWQENPQLSKRGGTLGPVILYLLTLGNPENMGGNGSLFNLLSIID